MNINIRNYNDSDFNEIVSWWNQANECPPLPGMMIENGTFVLELDNTPILSLTLFLTQSKEIAYLEGYIANPLCPKEVRREFGQMIWNHAFNEAKKLGYKRVICYPDKEKLVNRYNDLGMTKTLSNITAMVREL